MVFEDFVLAAAFVAGPQQRLKKSDARARDVDEEVANRSASWGLGQTMGNE